MSNLISMGALIDLAINNSDHGKVNFNALRSLLIGIIEHLQIGEEQKAFSDNITDYSNQSIEERLKKLENMIGLESQLIFNKDILNEVSAEEKEGKIIYNAWQKSQMIKNIDINTQGVNQIMKITDEMLAKFNEISHQQLDMEEKIEKIIKIQNEHEINIENLNTFRSELKTKITSMEAQLLDLKNNSLKKTEFEVILRNLVKYSDLEEYLAVNKFEGHLKHINEKFDFVNEFITNLKTLASKDYVDKKISKLMDKDMLQNMITSDDLEKRLNEYFHVKKIDDLLIEHKNLLAQCSEFAQKIKELNNTLGSMANKEYVDKKVSKLVNRDMLLNMITGEELERRLNEFFHAKNIDDLLIEHENLLTQCSNFEQEISKLQLVCEQLEFSKMDKNKINKLFEEVDINDLVKRSDHDHLKKTLNDINQEINKFMQNIHDRENEYSNAFKILNEDLITKLNKKDFSPIKRSIEQQLKLIMNKLEILKTLEYIDEDAAVLQKQLLQKLNCLSCSKSVNIRPKTAVPSLPFFPPMPMPEKFKRTKSAFEKGVVMDLERPCGGPHTRTNPHQRIHSSHSYSEMSVLTSSIDNSNVLIKSIHGQKHNLQGNGHFSVVNENIDEEVARPASLASCGD